MGSSKVGRVESSERITDPSFPRIKSMEASRSQSTEFAMAPVSNKTHVAISWVEIEILIGTSD